jgi:hypothetical protein
MSRRGTITQMTCPKCGTIGVKFVVGDGALREWRRLNAELDRAVSVPADVPDDADVVFCRRMGACGYEEYVERIGWENIDKAGVEFGG